MGGGGIEKLDLVASKPYLSAKEEKDGIRERDGAVVLLTVEKRVK